MTALHIRLPVVVDDADPTRCGETCPFWSDPEYPTCLNEAFRAPRFPDVSQGRALSCIRATNAAIDAEIEALRRGFSLCEGASSIGDGLREMRSERERLEARKVKP